MKTGGVYTPSYTPANNFPEKKFIRESTIAAFFVKYAKKLKRWQIYDSKNVLVFGGCIKKFWSPYKQFLTSGEIVCWYFDDEVDDRFWWTRGL